MYKIIAIMGEAGSGKDTLLKKLIEVIPASHEIVSYTTRPKREGEIEGINYHYLSDQEFQNKMCNNEMYEYTLFNSWYYGTGREALNKEKVNIGVFNPAGVCSLARSEEIDLYILRLRVSEKTRLLRQLNRENEPNVEEIIRRYHADKMDFFNFDENCIFSNNKINYLDVVNENNDLDLTARSIASFLDFWIPKGKNC